MKTKFITIIFLSLFLTNCKKENKDEIATKEVDVDIFKVELNLTSTKDDNICLLYTEDGSIDFTNGGTVWQNLKASKAPQKVTFFLPKDVYPTQLRFDFGFNKDQEDILISAINFEFNNNKREVIGSEMRLLFRPDDSKCTFDETGLIKPLIIDGVKQSPSLYPQEENLKVVLEGLVK